MLDRDIDEWMEEHGIVMSKEARGDLDALISREAEAARDEGYHDGHSAGYEEGEEEVRGSVEHQIEDAVSDALADFHDEISTALSLIDTDRIAAKVYLDRAINGLSFSVSKQEQTACLL